MRWSEGVLVSPVWGERGREVDCWLGCLDCMRLGDIFLREQFHKRCPAGRLIVDLVPWDCCWWRCKKQQWPLTYVVVGLRSVFVTLLNYYVMLCFKYDFTHKIPIPRPPVWCERGREVDCWLGCLDCMRLGSGWLVLLLLLSLMLLRAVDIELLWEYVIVIVVLWVVLWVLWVKAPSDYRMT